MAEQHSDTAGAATAPHSTAAGTEAHGGGAAYVESKALGLDATMWVALAMLVVIGLAIWKNVPAAIAAMLDKRIAEIRTQLDEAKALRADAEALRAEYQAKAEAATADAEAIRTQAEQEAEAIRVKAEADATALIARRQAMAEGKIAAAERAAVAEVRAKAASAAASAAAQLIAAHHNAENDKPLVDSAIARLN